MREERAGRKISGFFKAVMLAIISFFVIFLFFPDASYKFFGTGLRNPEKAGAAVQNAADGVGSIVDKAADRISDAANTIVDKAVDTVISK